SFMSNEDNFKRFITHVVTNYQSLREYRIDILMTHNSAYQGLENELFGEKFITEAGFEKAFDIHIGMIQAFHNRYHELLFEGVLLDKDDLIEKRVIEPVIQLYEKDIQVGGVVENQSLYKKLVYQNIENALDELNAEDKGRYYICNCPECNEHEAFIYKNNTKFIQCNRENHCGERMILQFQEKQSTHPTLKRIEKTFTSLSEDQKEALTWSMRVFSFAKKGLQSEAMDNGFRGLSKENVRQHVIDLQNKEVVQYFFKKTSSLLGKDYSKNSWMCERNI